MKTCAKEKNFWQKIITLMLFVKRVPQCIELLCTALRITVCGVQHLFRVQQLMIYSYLHLVQFFITSLLIISSSKKVNVMIKKPGEYKQLGTSSIRLLL